MRGKDFLASNLPSDDFRMKAASNDEQLSNVCRDIEARLTTEGADVERWQEYEELRDRHMRRVYAGARAG